MSDEEEQAHFDELFEDIFIELEDKVCVMCILQICPLMVSFYLVLL